MTYPRQPTEAQKQAERDLSRGTGIFQTADDPALAAKEAKQKLKEARRALREAERKLQHWFGRIEPDILDELVESTLSAMNEARELAQRLRTRSPD